MHKVKKKIISKEFEIYLLPATKDDLELLRIWKNKNKQSFFHKKNISKQEQIKWFEDFEKKDYGHIFIITYKGIKIGCIGFRIIEENLDIYNVILGDKKYGGNNLVGIAMQVLCSYLIDNYSYNINCKVLEDNRARNWYKKNGFIDIEYCNDYVLMQLDKEDFKRIKYEAADF